MNRAGKKYLVSAIVSTYKAERFLRGKLEDLEAQSMAGELEIIVIDSGSPQNERAIVEEFQKRYDNIRFLRTEKRETVYQAWNRGIRMASGEFVTNANTDDRLRNDAYEVLVRTLREHPECVLAYPDMRITQKENDSFADHTPYGFRDWPPFDPLSLIELCCVGPFPLWRRSLHDEIGYFDERFRSAADYEFWLRAALKHRFVHVPQFLGLYWLSQETVSRRGDLPTLEYLEVQKEYRPRYARLAPAAVPLEPQELEQWRALVHRAEAGDPRALPELEQFAQSHPRCGMPQYELAEIFYRKGEIGFAKKYFEKAVIAEPSCAAYADRLRAFLKSELYQALQHQTAYAAANPDDLETQLCAGMILVLLERYDAARKHYLRALEIDPGSAMARENLAFLERQSPSRLTSIVIVTGDQLSCTRECLESIERHTPEPHEVILVDNGSSDGTVPFLREFCAGRENYRLIENGKNVGFAAGCNIGMREARGGHILLLNNDTVVTRGWLSGMIEALERDPKAGIVGPMTNEIAGPQKLAQVPYRDMEELQAFAERFRGEHYGRRIEVDRVVGFCMLFTRELLETVGELDERFGSGNFEDDDFCLRGALAGFRCLIAGDVFIHHYGSRSFTGNRVDYAAAMWKNRKSFDAKWDLASLDQETAARVVTHNAMLRGTKLARRGKLNDAVELMLQEGIRFSPASPAPYLALAGILSEAGKWREALEVLEQVPAGRELEVALMRGRAFKESGEFAKAIEAAREAEAIDPEAPGTLHLQGVLALSQGETERGEELLRRAIALDPGFALPYGALAQTAWERGEREQGVRLAELAFVLAPLELSALALYHEFATACDQLPREEELLREALEIHRDHKGLCYGLIELLIRSRRYGEAMTEIERGAARFGLDDESIDAALQIRKLAGAPLPCASGKGSVSLCMIIKDEARHLPAVLDSVRGLADELVLVDTGSSDRSCDIARIFGARLFSFPWNGSFADARNFSLSQALGEWILVLDADEVIAAGDVVPLKELAQRTARPTAFSFTTRNYTHEVTRRNWSANAGEYPAEEEGRGWTPSDKVRLFPNDPGIRFEGAVHELVEPSVLHLGLPIHACDVPVHHYGKLDAERCAQKQEAYYLLGLKKLEEDGGSVEALTELARQATELNRGEEAQRLWHRLLQVHPENAEAYFNLGYLQLCAGEYPKARESALKGAQLAPGMKEAAFNLAKCELFLGNTEKALESCREMLEKWPDYPPALSLSCVCLLLQGEKAKAQQLLQRLAAMRFDCADFLEEYAAGLKKGEHADLALPLMELARGISGGAAP